jgi:phosphonate transport system permease protein
MAAREAGLMTTPPIPAPPPRNWSGAVMALLLVALVAASFVSLDLKWAEFATAGAVRSSAEFLAGFAPPELAAPFLLKTAGAALETLAMSAVGTLLAVMTGVLLAIPGAGRLGRPLRAAIRVLLNVLRSIPELVWASILLIAAGLGPFAGTLALAAHTAGVLGRLFADALENAPLHAEHSLRANGSPAMAAFMYATLPQTLPQMLSYTLYRWENNIRAAAVLGVVGAGGLGQMLKYHLSLFQMPPAATVILAMLALVALVDAVSFATRRWLTR